jgi:hypothetical protein
VLFSGAIVPEQVFFVSTTQYLPFAIELYRSGALTGHGEVDFDATATQLRGAQEVRFFYGYHAIIVTCRS